MGEYQRVDFLGVTYPDPHPQRGRAILRAHPEARALFGRNPATALIALALVVAQLAVGAGLAVWGAPWWAVLATAWLLGAWLTHALFVVIHETAHDLVLKGKNANLALGVFANIPAVLPFAVALGHFHRLHHRAQGQRGRDPDLPSDMELRFFARNAATKWLWHLLFPALQLTRSSGHEARDMLSPFKPWVLANVGTQLAFVVAYQAAFGWSALLYLLVSLYFMFALHPLAGRFIQEHHLVNGTAETSSYYGPANLISLNFGHHVEHHDLPAVPWNQLPKLRRLASEYYDNRSFHTSWTRLWLRFLFDRSMGIGDRLARPAHTSRRVGTARPHAPEQASWPA
jgi:sphingolipid delta-4 desaturase